MDLKQGFQLSVNLTDTFRLFERSVETRTMIDEAFLQIRQIPYFPIKKLFPPRSVDAVTMLRRDSIEPDKSLFWSTILYRLERKFASVLVQGRNLGREGGFEYDRFPINKDSRDNGARSSTWKAERGRRGDGNEGGGLPICKR